MKYLIAVFMLASVSAFAQDTIIEPTIIKCEDSILSTYVKVKGKKAVTIATKIKIEAREAYEGDPAVWSALHMIKVEFPNACFLIAQAQLSKVKTVKSIGYDAQKGRLIQMNVSVATGNYAGEIGTQDIDLKILVNQANGSLELIK